MCCSGRSRRIQSSALPAVALRGSMTKSVVMREPAVCSGWLASRRRSCSRLSGRSASSSWASVSGSSLRMSAASSASMCSSTLAARSSGISCSAAVRSSSSISCSVSAARPALSVASTRGALARADLADDVGDVGRVQLRELGERLHEVEPREPQRDEVDVAPGHEVAALLRQAAREEPEAEAPGEGGRARVDAADHEVVLGRLEHDVLDADEGAPAHVEHLVVEQRVDERELVRAQRGRLDRLDRHAEQQSLAVHVDLADLPPRGGELTFVAVDEEGGDHRRVDRGAGDHVAQLADLHAGGVEDFHAVELGERERSGDLVHEGVPILS